MRTRGRWKVLPGYCVGNRRRIRDRLLRNHRRIIAGWILHSMINDTTPLGSREPTREPTRERERDSSSSLSIEPRSDLHNSCKLVPTNACVAKIYGLFRVVRSSREEWVGFRWILNGREREGKGKKSLPFCDNNERNSISRVTREARLGSKKTCKKERTKRTFGNRANNSSNLSFSSAYSRTGSLIPRVLYIVTNRVRLDNLSFGTILYNSRK